MGNQHSSSSTTAEISARPSRPFRSGGALGLSKAELDKRCQPSGWVFGLKPKRTSWPWRCPDVVSTPGVRERIFLTIQNTGMDVIPPPKFCRIRTRMKRVSRVIRSNRWCRKSLKLFMFVLFLRFRSRGSHVFLLELSHLTFRFLPLSHTIGTC